MPHPVLAPRKVAVVTGGASGLGLAAARKFLGLGMRVAIADLPGDKLAAAETELGKAGVALAVPTDVSDPEQIRHLEATVLDQFGAIDLLMNNAGVQPGSDIFGPAANWDQDHRDQPARHHLRHADHRAGDARPRCAGNGDQHRVETGHHHAAGRSGL